MNKENVESVGINPDAYVDNAELAVFLALIDNGTLCQVPEDLYREIIEGYIQRYAVPCDNTVNVWHMRKRVGATYNELTTLMGIDAFLSDGLGLNNPYNFKYPQYAACYGWLDFRAVRVKDVFSEEYAGFDTIIDTSQDLLYFVNPEVYKTYFHENVLHFDPIMKNYKEEE
jgi:hypothetical protein